MKNLKTQKIITVIITLVLVLAMLGGCAKKVSTPAADPKGAPAAAKKITAVLVLNNNLGDKSYSDMAYAGLVRAGKELGINTKVTELGGDPTKMEPTLLEYAEDKNIDLIICGTPNIKEAAQKVAVQYPNKKFILYDIKADFDKYKMPFVYSVDHKQNEASFLAGAMAAKLTQSNVEGMNPKKILGIVPGGDNATVNDFLVGYIEGAEYVDAQTKVIISYVGDFKDSAKAKEMALAQYQQGADIVFQVASRAGLGVLSAAKDTGKLAIGVDSDQAMLFKDTDPNQAKRIVPSVVKRVDNTVFNSIKRAIDGTLPWGKYEKIGVAENAMSIAKNEYYNQIVPKDIRDLVDQIEAKIKSGEIKVSSAIGMSNEDLNKIRNRVKP